MQSKATTISEYLIGPVAVSSAGRNSEHLGGFIGRQPGEVAEFDQFRFLGMLGTQAVQSFVESVIRRREQERLAGQA